MTMNMSIDQKKKLQTLEIQRAELFKNAIETAKVVLTLGTPYAFEIIYRKFMEYEAVEKKLGEWVEKYSIISAMFLMKNPKDIYFKLDPATQALWDAVPELAAWRRKFR